MNPFEFSYLRKRSVVPLAVVLVLASTLFSMTALTLLGFHRGFTNYLGREENVLAIHDRSSRTPFTGLIPSSLAGRASSISGVGPVSPEAIAPAFVRGEPVFVRGVVPGKFQSLSGLEIARGSNLDYEDVDRALVGKRLARRLDLDPGDYFLASSAMAERYSVLEVKGIYKSGGPIDDEVLVPLYRGQWLRGTDHDHATLVRVGYDPERTSAGAIRRKLVGREQVEEEAGKPKPFWEIVPFSEISVGSGEVEASEAREFMGRYLEEFGATRGSLLALSAVIFLFAGAGVVVACRHLVSRHEEELFSLRSIGASSRCLKKDLLMRLTPWFLISSLLGLGLGYGATLALRGSGYLRILAHAVGFSLEPLVVVVLLVATLAIEVVSVIWASKEVDRV